MVTGTRYLNTWKSRDSFIAEQTFKLRYLAHLERLCFAGSTLKDAQYVFVVPGCNVVVRLLGFMDGPLDSVAIIA
jgi:hypothetical protein